MNAPKLTSGPEFGFRDDIPLSLEAVELELALQCQDPVEHGFEAALDMALETVGGTLLFHLRVDNLPDCQRVAAVSVGEGEDRQLVLVVFPSGGGPLRVETALENANPLAGFAKSYAGLMDRFSRG